MLSLSQLDTLHNYTVDHIIGEGSYGQVYAAEETSTQTRYAIKVIPLCFAIQAESELNILSSLSHRYCVSLHEALRDDVAYYLVTDHVSNGTLLQHLNYSHIVTEHDARQIFTQIFEGISYLHEVLQIAHLDLKLENIMIDSRSEVKIIDFGQARSFHVITGMRCGSPPYWAPEVISGRHLTPSVDIWSLGVILYVLVTRTFPFSAVETSRLTAQILFDEVTFPRDVSQECRCFISKMLEKGTDKRITLAGIAGDAWMNGHVSISKAFTLPRLELLHPSLPGGKFLAVGFNCAGKYQQIEQDKTRIRKGRRPRCTHQMPSVKTPLRRQSG
jgi:serine/threonine protein kinase